MANTTKTCPHCGEEILAIAQKCKHCKEFLGVSSRNHTVEQVTQLNDKELVMLQPYHRVFNIVVNAMNELGRLKQQDEVAHVLQGKIMYGLQSVKIRISFVEESGNRTRVVVQASSDDVWGAGAKNATKRLIETVRNYDNPGYDPDPIGMHPLAVGAVFAVTVAVIVIIVYLFSEV